MFEDVQRSVSDLVNEWSSKMAGLPEEVISGRRNVQNRTIRQITGHMVDSASNNTHRIIHLQYQDSPLIFPDYASLGNNDRWIAIQDYQSENWEILVLLWKFVNMHIVHIISRIDPEKLDNVWITALGGKVSLKDMVTDYPCHLKLHLDEIDELINEK